MIVLTTAVSVSLFFAAMWKLDILRIALDAVETSRVGVSAIRDPGLDDRARERTIRQVSLRLFVAFGSLATRAALAAAAAFLPIGLASAAGIAPADGVFRLLTTWQTAALATLAAGGAYAIGMLPWRAN